MTSEEYERLTAWATQLSVDLAIDSDEFRAALNIDNILDLAGVAAHTVIRPAAPVTTFLAGYAAGMAAAAGTSPAAAIRSADEVSRTALAAENQPVTPSHSGNAAEPKQPGSPASGTVES